MLTDFDFSRLAVSDKQLVTSPLPLKSSYKTPRHTTRHRSCRRASRKAIARVRRGHPITAAISMLSALRGWARKLIIVLPLSRGSFCGERKAW